MFRPVALYIGLRYTRAKRRSHFIAFISLVSMLGIALGVMVLITVLSVMNGFDDQIRTRFFAIAPQVTVTAEPSAFHAWETIRKQVNTFPQVINSAPFVVGQGMLSNDDRVEGVAVVGILPSEESKISELGEKMVIGSLSSLDKAGAYRMVIGQKLANQLGLLVGDSVNLFTPQTTITPFGVLPQFRRFNVGGIFNTDSGFGFDTGVAFINLQDAQKLFPSSGNVGLHVKLKDLYTAGTFTEQLQNFLPPGFIVTNWMQEYGTFFHAIAMEKTIMFVILLLIVGVAVFNLVSTLVMVVNDKRADIAILRTLGATRTTIMLIFIIQGAVVGLVGTLLGILGGIVLSLNATAIVDDIQRLFHVQFIQSSVYFVNFLPSQLQISDVLGVALIAFGLSLLATLYPAFIAFRTQPAEALRYE
ncbi:MAG: ABC transporter [Coxiella sp. RIFCSPHIGHO2_12_FULL_44_14]|nr:MAG: ABC transporter [Coxiella sp. RIFCSPHIGHO2_12_FULL_44_14]